MSEQTVPKYLPKLVLQGELLRFSRPSHPFKQPDLTYGKHFSVSSVREPLLHGGQWK